MKRRILKLSAIYFAFALLSWGVYNTYIYAPDSVPSGTQYWIYGGTQGDWSGMTTVTLLKDGSYFGDTWGDYYSQVTISAAETDYGNKTVQWDLVAEDSGGWSSETATAYVNIYITNRAPAGCFDGVSPSVVRGQNMAASGWAVDYEMGAPVDHVDYYIDGQSTGRATLNGSRPDVQNANITWGFWSPKDVTFSGWNVQYNTAALGSGTHSLRLVAYDSEGLSVDLGTKNFSVVNSAPDSTTISTGGVIQITLGQTISLSGTVHDADGNLVQHNLYYRGPSNGDWIPLLSGVPSGTTTSILMANFTPNEIGTWYFYCNGYDGFAWGSGATVTVVVNASSGGSPSGTGGFKVHKP